MAVFSFILRDGRTQTLTAHSGTVMDAARAAGIVGIIGECGGACACGTCHVHLLPDDFSSLGAVTTAEENLLEFDDNAVPTSRLSCQIKVTQVPDGTVFIIPGAEA